MHIAVPMTSLLLGLATTAAWFLAAAAVEDELSLLQLPVIQRAPLGPKNQAIQLAPLDSKSQAARLQAALPVSWVHVPKCGSSFANFLIDLPGVCPGVPQNLTIADSNRAHKQLIEFNDVWHVDSPSGACESNIFRWGNHAGVGSVENWTKYYKNHAMIMLRRPEQRTLSAYWDNTHSWPNLLPPRSPLEYAQVLQGCAVRMLTRAGSIAEESCGDRFGGGPPTENEVQLAISRLRNDFAFVGLTDEWALSICLGHRMFGGSCHATDFIDNRVSRGWSRIQVRTKPAPWDEAQLQGFHDPYDGALYAAAQEVFEDELWRYGVSVESCQPCFDAAGVNVSSV